MEAERLLSLAVAVAAERSLQSVLQTIVQGLASHPGVALARIWLQLPGDICDCCFLRAQCRDRAWPHTVETLIQRCQNVAKVAFVDTEKLRKNRCPRMAPSHEIFSTDCGE